jgi:hypothetical protein
MSAEIFAEVGESDDLMEELAARTQLQDDVVVLLGFGEVDQSDDIGMIKLTHDLDFLEDIRSLDDPRISRWPQIKQCITDESVQHHPNTRKT